jgi:glucokinase
MNYAIGLDIGGTQIKGVCITSSGRLLHHLRIPTGDDLAADWTHRIAKTLHDLQDHQGAEAAWVGIAAPGIAAADGRSIVWMRGRMEALQGLDWQKALHAPWPIPVLNDAHAALLGEAWTGAARDVANAVLLTLGTGVGGAILLDGRLLRGHLGRSGEIGHISVNHLSPHKDIANTPGSLELAIGEVTLKQRSHGRFSHTTDLVNAYLAGDKDAEHIWLQSLHALACGLTSVINTLDPERIILGGGIAEAGPALFKPLAKLMDDVEWRPFGKAKAVPIVKATLGDLAGAIGAAWNAINETREPVGL